MLDVNNQNSKQKVLISLSVSLLESERIICLTNSGGNAYIKLEEKFPQWITRITVTLDQVDQMWN